MGLSSEIPRTYFTFCPIHIQVNFPSQSYFTDDIIQYAAAARKQVCLHYSIYPTLCNALSQSQGNSWGPGQLGAALCGVIEPHDNSF